MSKKLKWKKKWGGVWVCGRLRIEPNGDVIDLRVADRLVRDSVLIDGFAGTDALAKCKALAQKIADSLEWEAQ